MQKSFWESFLDCFRTGTAKKRRSSGALDPKKLPHDLLAQALFENAMLHGQKFARQFELGPSFSVEDQAELATQIIEYAVSIMIIHFHAAGKIDLKEEVIKKHADFMKEHCGTNDPEAHKEMLKVWKTEIQRKVMWLSLGSNVHNLEASAFAKKIIAGQGFRTKELDKFRMGPQIEQFVNDVSESMKHFGICEPSTDHTASRQKPEIQEALRVFDEAARTFGKGGFDLVRTKAERILLEDPAPFVDAVRKGWSVRKCIYTSIANISGDMVESGQYHIGRGVLNSMGLGKDLLNIFDSALDELVRLGARSKEKAQERKQGIRRNIEEIG